MGTAEESAAPAGAGAGTGAFSCRINERWVLVALVMSKTRMKDGGKRYGGCERLNHIQ